MVSKHGSGSWDDLNGDHPVGSASVTRRTWWNIIEYTDPPPLPSLPILPSLAPSLPRMVARSKRCGLLLADLWWQRRRIAAVPAPSLRPMLW